MSVVNGNKLFVWGSQCNHCHLLMPMLLRVHGGLLMRVASAPNPDRHVCIFCSLHIPPLFFFGSNWSVGHLEYLVVMPIKCESKSTSSEGGQLPAPERCKRTSGSAKKHISHPFEGVLKTYDPTPVDCFSSYSYAHVSYLALDIDIADVHLEPKKFTMSFECE